MTLTTPERAKMMGEKGLQAIIDPRGRRAFIEIAEDRRSGPRSLASDADRRLAEQGPGLPRARLSPGGASIDAGARALASAFGALASGSALEMSAIIDAGERIIDAVAEVGLAKWLSTVRKYHQGTFQHCLLVTGVATSFGQRSGMRRADIATLTVAGLLHDIGKAQIPISLLDKPDKLTEAEFAIVKSHPVIGYDYLRRQDDSPAQILSAVRHHHEYLDGSGYPDGLDASQIDDVTRIVTVCDVYAALVERRAYKPPRSPEQAAAILLEMAAAGKVEESLARVLSLR